MTQDEARHLKDAAVLILHAADHDLGDNAVTTALRNLPAPVAVGDDERERLMAAREILEREEVWQNAERADHE